MGLVDGRTVEAGWAEVVIEVEDVEKVSEEELEVDDDDIEDKVEDRDEVIEEEPVGLLEGEAGDEEDGGGSEVGSKVIVDLDDVLVLCALAVVVVSPLLEALLLLAEADLVALVELD